LSILIALFPLLQNCCNGTKKRGGGGGNDTPSGTIICASTTEKRKKKEMMDFRRPSAAFVEPPNRNAGWLWQKKGKEKEKAAQLRLLAPFKRIFNGVKKIGKGEKERKEEGKKDG